MHKSRSHVGPLFSCTCLCTKEPKERPAWFGRDEKVSEQTMANRAWQVTTRGELMKMKEELERAILDAPAEIHDKVATELSLMSNRVKAIKLVLSLPCTHGEAADAEATTAERNR